MLIPDVAAGTASSPFDEYASKLEIPSGKDPNQNAWLTLTLNVRLNFVDSTNLLSGLTVKQDGKVYARDADGWLFPLLDWPKSFKEKFAKQFQSHAEKVWNWQFVLITPKTYTDLDVTSFAGPGWLVRPNVLCLFRLTLDDSAPGKTINVVNLDLRTTSVSNIDAAKAPKALAGRMDNYTFRSNAVNYDDRDLFEPAMFNVESKVIHDTIGHEVGHALGQDHIMLLKGVTSCKTAQDGGNATPCYGHSLTDKFNIMGGGDRIYLINAISWRERIAVHTGTKPTDWEVTGIMGTPPRKIPVGISHVGPTPAF